MIPCNAPPNEPTCLLIDDGSQPGGAAAVTETFDAVDQYTIQGDLFAEAIRGDRPLTIELENSVMSMRIIDAIVRSGASGRWETP